MLLLHLNPRYSTQTQGSGIPKYKTIGIRIPSVFKKEDLDEYRGEKEFKPKYQIKIEIHTPETERKQDRVLERKNGAIQIQLSIHSWDPGGPGGTTTAHLFSRIHTYYKLTYYTPDYETKDTDILAAFRVTPQPRVPPEETGVAVVAESSTGTWTTVWTDGLTSLDRYKGRCYHIEPVAATSKEEKNYLVLHLATYCEIELLC
ncbi:hypothetical protein Lal_00015415 [Lupinus albus]|nr:hypothetical protein Lal_00015415 [Lupinus albus]